MNGWQGVRASSLALGGVSATPRMGTGRERGGSRKENAGGQCEGSRKLEEKNPEGKRGLSGETFLSFKGNALCRGKGSPELAGKNRKPWG